MVLRAGMLVGILLGGLQAFAGQSTIDDDRMLVLNGKRTFILGLYEYPEDEARLDEVASAGFNLVQATAAPKEVTSRLDRLHAKGLSAWVNLGSNVSSAGDPQGIERALRNLVSELGAYPALAIWEVPDEALWNCWYEANLWRRHDEPAQQLEKIDALADTSLAEALRKDRERVRNLFEEGAFAEAEALANAIWRKMDLEPPHPDLNFSNAPERSAKRAEELLEGYRVLKSIDPGHPVWMNHAPRNQIAQLARFNHAADIVGCDIYPAPAYRVGHSDLADRSLSSVGAFTLRMQEAAPGKPVWMVLQGFGWPDIGGGDLKEAGGDMRRFRPSFAESRFMAYDAIVRGARGLLYWGTAYIEKDAVLWQDLLRLVAELDGFQTVLAAPDMKLDLTLAYEETWGSLDRGVVVLPKDVEGRPWLIAVNEWEDPLVYTIGGLDRFEDITFEDTATEARASVNQGKLRLTIRGNGVQVLAPKP